MKHLDDEKFQSVEDLIRDIKSHTSEITRQAFKRKRVKSLPNLPFELELADGWTSKLILANATRDMWLKRGRPGTILPEHYHPNSSEIATVVSGACLINIKSGETRELNIGESITIERGKLHEIIAHETKGCELMVIYQPPLTYSEKKAKND